MEAIQNQLSPVVLSADGARLTEPEEENVLVDAIRDIENAKGEWQRTRQQRAELRRPIREIDTMLARLEELHLAGRRRVPAAWGPGIVALLEMLPPDCRRPFALRTTVSRLMDELFEMQDSMLDRCASGRNADQAQDEALA